jgi:hypothetical protein
LIKAKELAVISKMERLAGLVGKSERNYTLENQLIEDLNAKKSFINENPDYKPKVEGLASTISSMGFESTASADGDFFKDFDFTRFEKSVNNLAEMKKILEVTLSDLRQSSAIVNFIHKDVETLKKYGKI